MSWSIPYSLFIEIWRRISKGGKVTADEYGVILHYIHKDLKNYISHFELHIRFINSSGYKRVLKRFRAKFYSLNESYDLQFDEHLLSPAIAIEPDSPKVLEFKLYPEQNFSGTW